MVHGLGCLLRVPPHLLSAFSTATAQVTCVLWLPIQSCQWAARAGDPREGRRRSWNWASGFFLGATGGLSSHAAVTPHPAVFLLS